MLGLDRESALRQDLVAFAEERRELLRPFVEEDHLNTLHPGLPVSVRLVLQAADADEAGAIRRGNELRVSG